MILLYRLKKKKHNKKFYSNIGLFCEIISALQVTFERKEEKGD